MFLFVPYIKTTVLKKLVDDLDSKIVIVTTWKTIDLLSGISELDLYPFCKTRRITLYINNKIHLKIYSSNLDNMILSTANISERGLEDIPNANFECATYIDNLSNEDRLYFAQIQKNARHVNEELYQSLLKWYNDQEWKMSVIDEFDKIVSPIERDDFLISSLPMSKDVETLEEAYFRINQGLPASADNEIRDCAFHDLANYKLSPGLSREEFRKQLKNSFFSHPFIKRINELIVPEVYFGKLKEWVQANCTDVPVPSRRELTGNVQVLLKWFEILGDGKYVVDVPGSHSQRLRKTV